MKANKTNIVLIGMRGSGKSLLGKKLAQLLNKKFFDADRKLEAYAKKKIAQIVEEKGWEHFRQLEKQIVKSLSQEKNAVISTGGGVVLDEDNINELKKNGIIIFLHADTKVLSSRIKTSKRPSLTGKNISQELEQIWQERKQKYFKSADITLRVDHFSKNLEKDADLKAQKILKLLKSF